MAPPRSRLAGSMVALGAILGIAVAASPSAGPGDPDANHQRLRGMPLERRAALAEALERFDRLPAAEREAIRRLDAQVAAKDPVVQARYRAALRRYHQWVAGLTDDQRRKLADAPGIDARFDLASKLRQAEQAGTAPGPRVAGVRIGEFGMIAPSEAATLLKVWATLDQDQRDKIARRPPGQIRDELRSRGETGAVLSVSLPMTAADEARFDARLKADPTFKAVIPGLAQAETARLKKEADRLAEEIRKNASPEAQKRADEVARRRGRVQKRVERPYAEFLYFEAHRPKPVTQANLDRFAATCPAWFRGMLDPIPPDDARDYLTIVYRLIHPHPAEVPAGPTTAGKPATPSIRPPANPRRPPGGPV